jgi:DNA-directed RNA polymerase specialized sigma24 family protein
VNDADWHGERALIIAAQEGAHDAFGELVRRQQAHLRGFAARDVQDSGDVYDLMANRPSL